ncbi:MULTISPECIES: TAXI family TRAP transporter solute-binding subunit [unclassified Kribbella]|uniref:TAXI family TRAP transporter solute-binding subunit n=1 Tax=unclassified Kribbella TaxID=2644121 RepID=UPI003017BC6D
MDRPRLLTPAGNGLIQSAGMSRRSMLGLGAAAVAALAVPGCSRGRSDEPAPAGPATLATGNKGGVYDEFGGGLAKLVSEVTGMELQTVPSGGSVDNLYRVAGMKNDLGFTTSDTALNAYEGTGLFSSGALKFTALARTYDNYVHVVVPTASDVVLLKHLAGKTVNVGPMNSGTKVVADLILNTSKLSGVRTTNYTLEEAVKQLKVRADNQGKGPGIDALIWSGGLPTKPIAELQASVGFRLVDIGTVAEEISLKRFGGYVVSSIPPSVYGLASSVPTLAVPNYLIARPNLSDSWAWWTVNTMFRRQNDLMAAHQEAGSLDPRSAIATMPIPLHPAAERWYRANHI